MNLKFQMVAQGGIEPPTQGFSVLCSTNWAIEPKKMAVLTRIELAIFSVTGRHVNHYTTRPGCGGRIWTNDLRVMSPTSYQTALPRDIIYFVFKKMAEEQGFEPWLDSHLLPVFKTGPFNHLGIPPFISGGPCRTRTYDRPVMSRKL